DPLQWLYRRLGGIHGFRLTPNIEPRRLRYTASPGRIRDLIKVEGKDTSMTKLVQQSLRIPAGDPVTPVSARPGFQDACHLFANGTGTTLHCPGPQIAPQGG